MKVCHTLICCFFLAVQDGVAVSSQNIRKVKEGENITVQCSFNFSGTRKYFCKNKCEDRNVLIETTDNEAQKGRYSIEYKEGFYPATSTVLYVSITQLKKSDSGWYSCHLDRTYLSDGFKDFEIFVTDASVTSTPKSTSAFSTSTFLPSASTTTTTTTTTQSVSSSSGGSTPSSPSSSSGSGLLLYVGLILIVMLVILSAALLIFWRRRRRRATKPRGISGPPVETEYADVREVNLEYEEIREDGRRRPPPVKFTKTNAADGADDDNFVVQ